MRRIRVNRSVARAAAATLCLAAAVLLALVAVDAHAWGKRMPADDLSFRHQALGYSLWRGDDVAPFALAAVG